MKPPFIALIAALLIWENPIFGTEIECYLSPNGGGEAAVIRALDAAKKEVLVQAYSFTSTPISDALIAAHKRGVDVQVICDKGQRGALNSQGPVTLKAGIPTTIDAKHAIAHAKIMVIDDKVSLVGSYNWTNAAEHSNSEDLLVIHDDALAATLSANWHAHREHSDPWGVRSQKRGTRR